MKSGSPRPKKKWNLACTIIFYLIAWFLIVTCQDADECFTAANPKILNAEIGKSKLFTTPGFYRGVYPPNKDCHWIIKSPGPDAWIQLSIHYSHMEDRLFTDCDDYVEIRDGATNQSPVLLKWCGYFNPSAFSSMNDALYIRFKSDQFFEDGRGVNMSFIAYPRPGCPPTWRESTSTGNCYHLVSPKPPFPKMSWVDAQKRCSYERGNLLTVTNYDEYIQVVGFYESTGESPWVGVTDAQEENRFVAVDPNAKLYPDPFKVTSNDDSRDCVFMDLKNGGTVMYDVDDCRAERSYMCQRRKDGSTVPYPPPESIIKQSLVAPAGVILSPAYIWLIVLVLLIILLIICVPCFRKRYKEYKSNQVSVPSETDSRNILIRNNNSAPITNAASNNNGITNIGHTTGAVGQHMPPPSSNLLLAYDNYIPEKKLVESAATIHTMPGMAASSTYDPGALTYRKISMGNGHIHPTNSEYQQQSNGFVHGKGKQIFTVAPVEKFDRPVIRPLDNVSAISLDEFWHKIEVERIRKIDVRESPPERF